MTDFTNIAEIREQTRQQRVEAKQAVWAGRSAFLDGKDWDANPHAGWNKHENGLHTHQCLLWCRWMYGWLLEFYNRPAHAAAGQPGSTVDSTVVNEGPNPSGPATSPERRNGNQEKP